MEQAIEYQIRAQCNEGIQSISTCHEEKIALFKGKL